MVVNLGTLGYMISEHKFSYWFMKSRFKKFVLFTVCWLFMTFSMIMTMTMLMMLMMTMILLMLMMLVAGWPDDLWRVIWGPRSGLCSRILWTYLSTIQPRHSNIAYCLVHILIFPLHCPNWTDSNKETRFLTFITSASKDLLQSCHHLCQLGSLENPWAFGHPGNILC